MVEYALAVSLIVLAAMGAIKSLERGASRETVNQAQCVSTRPPPASCQVRAVTPTSPTTAGPGPTTPPPPAPLPATAQWSGQSTSGDPAGVWGTHATFNVAADGPPPGPIAGVRMRVNILFNGFPSGFFGSCTTGTDGRCTIDFDVPITGITSVTYDVTDESISLPEENSNFNVTQPPDLVFTPPPPIVIVPPITP